LPTYLSFLTEGRRVVRDRLDRNDWETTV